MEVRSSGHMLDYNDDGEDDDNNNNNNKVR
jgi:hypothetical protein